jgi:hypothetical protein
MEIQIVIIIITVALLGYIVLLRLQISKKNIFIESAFRRLSGIENSPGLDKMREFLIEIQKIKWFTTFYKERFLDDSMIDFILENNKDLKIFLHYTMDESDAKSILKDGFKFSNSFYKTALSVSNDLLDMKIKHKSRKFFGDFIITICISNDIVNFYSTELRKAGIKNYSFENILTETTLPANDNSETGYLLPSPFIKGYIQRNTGEIIRNSSFDPYYDSAQFMKNIELLKNK